MSEWESTTFIANDGDQRGTATRLLEAAEAADMPSDVVRVAPGFDGWYVPAELGEDGTPAEGRNAFVPNAGDQKGTATALLEAAEAAGLPPSVVQDLPGFDGWVVPPEIAPTAPVVALAITEPKDGDEVDPLVAIRGTAPTGSTVDLYMDSSPGGPVGSVQAADGRFEFTGSTPLEVSPEGIAVGVGEDRSSKVNVTVALPDARTTTTTKGTAG